MTLPFTNDAFFGVFARYNTALWPAGLALWLWTVVVVMAVARRPGLATDRLATTLLVTLWSWSGVVYHGLYFAEINPAAPLFAVAFVAEAALLAWSGLIRRRLEFRSAIPSRRLLGLGLALYALIYPGVNLWLGHDYPETPGFGVPCPTTILTTGLFLSSQTPPLAVMPIPILWSVIGGSAAILLDVRSDFVLLACAAILLATNLNLLGRRLRGRLAA